MSRKRSGTNTPSAREVEEALAAIIASTRRGESGRTLDLLQVARYVEVASAGLGGLAELSERVGLSQQMLRDFLSVARLVPKVQRLLKRRLINSIDVACRIARLPPEDQVAVAEAVARHRLDGRDVRAVLALRRAAPVAAIEDAIQRVVGSRNIKEYVAEFVVPGQMTDKRLFEARFAEVVGAPNIRRVELSRGVGVLAVNSEGRRRLERAAAARGLSKRAFVDLIVSGETV